MSTRSGMIVLLGFVVLTGCGQTSTEDALQQRPLSDVIAEANELSNDGLERQARAYRDAVVKQNEELDRLKQTKRDLDYVEKTGPRAKELDKQMQVLGKSIGRLIERHRVYINRLHQKGLPTDGLEL